MWPAPMTRPTTTARSASRSSSVSSAAPRREARPLTRAELAVDAVEGGAEQDAEPARGHRPPVADRDQAGREQRGGEGQQRGHVRVSPAATAGGSGAPRSAG